MTANRRVRNYSVDFPVSPIRTNSSPPVDGARRGLLVRWSASTREQWLPACVTPVGRQHAVPAPCVARCPVRAVASLGMAASFAPPTQVVHGAGHRNKVRFYFRLSVSSGESARKTCLSHCRGDWARCAHGLCLGSCDDTGVAIVERASDGATVVRGHVVCSQFREHSTYKGKPSPHHRHTQRGGRAFAKNCDCVWLRTGVVPLLAARCHDKNLPFALDRLREER